MKLLKIFMLVVSLMISQNLMAQQKEVNALLHAYYAIKDGMVASDATAAGKQAGTFLKALQMVPTKSFTNSQLKTWNRLAPKIKKEAEHIHESSDIEYQRDYLNDLSLYLYDVLKVLKMHDQEIYYQYCSMKKAYWLSNEPEIKNPYYGNKMLTCGNIKETLK